MQFAYFDGPCPTDHSPGAVCPPVVPGNFANASSSNVRLPNARLFLVWPHLVDGSVAGGGAQSAFSVFDVSSTELTVTFIDSAGTVLYKVRARAPNAEPLSLRPALSFRRPQTLAIKPRAKAEKPGFW